MAPDPLNERVAALEPQLSALQADVSALQDVQSNMLTQITELKADLKLLSWKVAIITGSVLLVGNKFLDWGLGKFLKP